MSFTAEQLLTCLQESPPSERMSWNDFCGKMSSLHHISPAPRDGLVVFTKDFLGGTLPSRVYHVTSQSSFWNCFDTSKGLLGSALDGNDNDVNILPDFVLAETPAPVSFCLIVPENVDFSVTKAPSAPSATSSPSSPSLYEKLRDLFVSGAVPRNDIDRLRTVDGTRHLFGDLGDYSIITASTKKVFEQADSPYSPKPIKTNGRTFYLFDDWRGDDSETIQRFLEKYPSPTTSVSVAEPLQTTISPTNSIEAEYINWLCETRGIDKSTAEEYVEIARFVESASSRFGLVSSPFISAPDYATAKGTLDALRNSTEFKTELNNQFQDRNIGDARLFLTFLKERQT